MIRHILALIAALTPTIASAQKIQDGFVRPPDVRAYVDKFNGYAAGSTENQVGDGSTARGGTMPVIATMPADIPSTATGWIVTTADATTTCGVPGSFETVCTPASEEAKFRTTSDISHVAFDDPVRNFGQPGTSHCHQFFGNTQTNAFSTYAGLRTRANARAAQSKAASTIGGGPYNATAYWFPCVIKPNAFGDGKNYVVKASDITLYYLANPATLALAQSRIPRGLRYVLGTNMDDPYDTSFKAEIATANAQSGTSGRYAWRGNGFTGWHCIAPNLSTIRAITVAEHPATYYTGQNYYQGFKTAGGADPWGGNCVAGDWLVANFIGPDCYDGNNLWSPGGYKHFRQRVVDNTSSLSSKGCPNGWFQLPVINFTVWFKHQGYSDYGTWYLSSDAMATTKAQQINPAATAMTPGQSMHTDWMGGWDDTTFMKWQDNCLGVSGGTMHTCDSSRISATEVMQTTGNAPDGSRNPQVSGVDAFTTLTRGDMVEVPASLTGPHAIHVH